MPQRIRSVGSIKNELVRKSREAMLAAVQIFNNPQIDFKSELFIVTTVIAWTYLLHAYFRKEGIEYRQLSHMPGRKKFATTPRGATRLFSLENCLDSQHSPVQELVKQNLCFLIGIRHEIEHQGTSRIDDQLSAKFMSAALNFNEFIKKHFGTNYSLENEQAFSIQFSTFNEESVRSLITQSTLPANIRTFITEFEAGMTPEQFNDPRFSFRVAFVRKLANGKSQADRLVEFVPAGPAADEMNRVYVRETEKPKFRPGQVVALMIAEGFTSFSMHVHTELWHRLQAKRVEGQYGSLVAGTWFWYPLWVETVRRHCQETTAQNDGPESADRPLSANGVSSSTAP